MVFFYYIIIIQPQLISWIIGIINERENIRCYTNRVRISRAANLISLIAFK